MIRISLLLVALTLSFSARAETTPANKGWILFSWQTNKGWHYAVLPHKGTEKRWAELTLVKVKGWDALKAKLKNIPAGEHLAYGSRDEIADPPEERLLEVPRTEIRHLIRVLAKDRGFQVGSPHPPARSTISD